MLSLKTLSNLGSVLTLDFLHIKFSVCFVFILHITQLLAVLNCYAQFDFPGFF